ncbi:Fic/DOC family N-terminal domain-containing protein [Leptospira fletcheri]|uniref:Fic/DOC family N-terminal domain-containing protein n=1 Tax=Leptospira fletcheri TaxID=2484981 RepID=UPI00143859B4|nr:Fic/DOC family N-terminal domain-containing protein [Leptospira fletcheri]
MHKPFSPISLSSLPPEIEFSVPEIYSVLPEFRAALGELKGYAELLPNRLLLLSPVIIKESLASSEIESIHTTLEDVLQQTLFPEAEQRLEDKEVIRYRHAILWGTKLCGRLRFLGELYKVSSKD